MAFWKRLPGKPLHESMEKPAGMGRLFAVLLLIWQISATIVANDIILPQPFQVFAAMLMQGTDPAFWPAVFRTLGRVVAAVILALASGLFLALMAHLCRHLEFFSPGCCLSCVRCPTLHSSFWCSSG